jgi:hypothetical protein
MLSTADLACLKIRDLVHPVQYGGEARGNVAWDGLAVEFGVFIDPETWKGRLRIEIPAIDVVQEVQLGFYASGRLRKLPADSHQRGKTWYAIDSKNNHVRLLYYIPDRKGFFSRWDANLPRGPSWKVSGREVAERAALARDKAIARAATLRPGSKAWHAAIARRDAAQAKIDAFEEAREAKKRRR